MYIVKSFFRNPYFCLYFSFFAFATLGIMSKVVSLPVIYIMLFLNFFGFLGSTIILRRWRFSFNKECCFTSLVFSVDIFCLIMGYIYAGVAVTLALHYSAPIIVTLLSPFIFKIKFKVSNIISVIIGFIGVILVLANSLFDSEVKQSTLGIFFATLSGLTLAFNIIFSKITVQKHRDYKGLVLQYNFNMFILSFVAFVILLFFDDKSYLSLENFNLRNILLLAFFSIFTKSFASLLFNSSIRFVAAQKVGRMAYTEVMWGILFGIFFFNESLKWTQIIGIALILSAGYFSVPAKKAKIE